MIAKCKYWLSWAKVFFQLFTDTFRQVSKCPCCIKDINLFIDCFVLRLILLPFYVDRKSVVIGDFLSACQGIGDIYCISAAKFMFNKVLYYINFWWRVNYVKFFKLIFRLSRWNWQLSWKCRESYPHGKLEMWISIYPNDDPCPNLPNVSLSGW